MGTNRKNSAMMMSRIVRGFRSVRELREIGLSTIEFFPAPEGMDPRDLAGATSMEGSRRWLWHRRALLDYVKSGEEWPTVICEASPLPTELAPLVAAYDGSDEDFPNITFLGSEPAKCYVVDLKGARALLTGPMAEYCDVLEDLPVAEFADCKVEFHCDEG
jgi:hypothetical protein